MVKLKKVVSDDLYEQINSYVESNKIIVEDYEGMVKTILRMTKDGYCFTMDRDILRDAMESLTYMYAPDDDMNKDRLTQQLVDDEDDSDDEDSEEGDEGGEGLGNMDLMKMMQLMGGMGGMPDMSGMPECPPCTPPTDEEVIVKKADDTSSDKCDGKKCPVTDETCNEDCSEDGCVKEESSKDEELVPAENVD
jgi:hypothetical protein